MEITENFIREKYNIAQQTKEIQKQIDTIIFYINGYSLDGTYNSVTDFLTHVREKIETEHPQIKKTGENPRQFFKLKLFEDYDEIYFECEIFEMRPETEIETIQRLIRKEKYLVSRQKKSQREQEEKLILFNKLKAELY